MKRVKFQLSMPGVASLDGKWTGSGKHYFKVKTMTDAKAKELFGDKPSRSWYHRWSDGWCACVEAHIMEKGERVKKSDGFYGYDWMVENIWLYGETCKPGEKPA